MGEDSVRWTENLLRNDIAFFNARVGELERRLRRRAIGLAGAVAFGALSFVAAGLAVARLSDLPELDRATEAAPLSQPQADLGPLPSAVGAEASSVRDLRRELDDVRAAEARSRQEAAGLALQVGELRGVVSDLERQLAHASAATASDAAERDQRVATLERDAAVARHEAGSAREETEPLARQIQELAAVRVGLERDLATARGALAGRTAEAERSPSGRPGAGAADAPDRAAKEIEERDRRIAALEAELAASREWAERLSRLLTEAGWARPDREAPHPQASDRSIAAENNDCAKPLRGT